MSKKLMEALELVINEEDQAAELAMHEYFVSVARAINEEMEDQELEEVEDMEDDLMGDLDSSEESDDVAGDMDEIDTEEGVSDDEDENEEEFEDEGSEDLDSLSDEEGGADSEEGLQDRVTDLEDALQELEAEFQSIMGDDEGLEGDDSEFGGEEEFGGDGDFGGEEDFGSDEEFGSEGDEDFEGDEDLFADDDEDGFGEDELGESVELSKVSAPKNSEGQEVGKSGSSFKPNTTQNVKAQGNLKTPDRGPQMSKGGETKGHKEFDKQKGAKAKDMNAPNNMVKGDMKKVAAPSKGASEVGAGKSVSEKAKSVVGKNNR